MALSFDPGAPGVAENPYPLLAELRRDDPVHWSPALKSWIVTRYDDVRSVLAGPEHSPDRLTPFYEALPSETRGLLTEAMRYLNLWLVFRDPPEHTRLRALMNRTFAQQAIQQRRGEIEAIARDLLDPLEGCRETDLVASFTMPLPALVIMALLGVPRALLADVKQWSDDMMLFIMSARGSDDKYARARNGATAMAALFRELIAERRRVPKDDMLSELIAARDGSDSLAEDELIATSMLFLFAGHETTTNLLSNSIVTLLAHRSSFQQLVDEHQLPPAALEELLRFCGPTNAMGRIVRQDHEIAGRHLAKGDRVFAMINAANRDPARFPDPERLDLARQPNRHLTFGQGIHFCLGATLARLETQIALPLLLERFPRLSPGDEAPEWINTIAMRGLKRLPVKLDG